LFILISTARREEEEADLLRLQDADGTVYYYPFTIGAHADSTTDSTEQPGSPNTTHRAYAGLRDLADRIHLRSNAVQQTFLRQRLRTGWSPPDCSAAPV
jgi:hypothetical protein